MSEENLDPEFLKEIQDCFLAESEDLLGKAESLFMDLENPDRREPALQQLKRIAHNFKGSGKAVGFESLSKFCHELENLLVYFTEHPDRVDPSVVDILLKSNDVLREDLVGLRQSKEYKRDYSQFLSEMAHVLTTKQNQRGSDTDSPVQVDVPRVAFEKPIFKNPEAKLDSSASNVKVGTGQMPGSSQDDSIRLPMQKIDEVLNLFGEQVIMLSRLEHLNGDYINKHDEITRTLFSLKKLAFDLQQSTLSLRMVNLKSLFTKLERAARDAARMTGKKIQFEQVGAELEIDKTIADQIADPLIHMVRNSVDHGIEENSESRKASGKVEAGRIRLTAKRQGGSFIIEVSDDGKGLDSERILAKALKQGLARADIQYSQEQIFEFLFENGFSTKDTATELSGRGVGMNVVREVVRSLKGEVHISSELGQGTDFRLELPQTLSLFNGMVVDIGDEQFVIPSSQIHEILDGKDVPFRELPDGKRCIQVRDRVLDLIELPTLMTVRAPQKEKREESTAALRKKGGTQNLPGIVMLSEIQGATKGFLVSSIVGVQRIVQKPLSGEMFVCPGASGLTILGNGNPVFILDLTRFSIGSHHSPIAGVA